MKIKLFLMLCLVPYLFKAYAQKTNEPKYGVEYSLEEPSNLFVDDEVLLVSLRFKVKQYTSVKPREYIPAILTYHASATDSFNHKVKLKSRGEFRNQFCDFPPIKLNFKKGGYRYDDLENMNKVKLVTHCQYTSESEENIFKEYLCYKLFNVLTDNSFRVRLLKINYIDTGKKNKTRQQYGFLIEPVELLSERQEILHTDVQTVSQLNIEPKVLNRVAIFNYMIGNGDWSVTNQHNLKVFVPTKPASQPNGIAVPYDFDYSGMVNASYAVPNESSCISSVTERYYMGLCRDEAVFNEALKEFIDQKEKFYQVITDFDWLDKHEKKQMLNYLDSFYDEIEDKRIINNLQSTCLQK